MRSKKVTGVRSHSESKENSAEHSIDMKQSLVWT